MSEDEFIKAMSGMKGILKVIPLTESDVKEIERLEAEAENNVLMGFCRGINVGVRDALAKKRVYACLTDMNLKWPECSLIKIVCGSDVIGEQVVDKERLEGLKACGNIVTGDVVFYKEKMRLIRERQGEMRVLILPLEMPEILGIKAKVGSPSPPADTYLKRRLDANLEDPKLGTVLVGFDE